MKKTPSKVAHDRPPTFFLCTGPAAQTAQKQKSRTTKKPFNAGLGIQTGGDTEKLMKVQLQPLFPVLQIWMSPVVAGLAVTQLPRLRLHQRHLAVVRRTQPQVLLRPQQPPCQTTDLQDINRWVMDLLTWGYKITQLDFIG